MLREKPEKWIMIISVRYAKNTFMQSLQQCPAMVHLVMQLYEHLYRHGLYVMIS